MGKALKSELGKGLDLTSGFREGEGELCSEAWMEKVWVVLKSGFKKVWVVRKHGSLTGPGIQSLDFDTRVENLGSRKAREYQCVFALWVLMGWPGNR